ncbi:short chain dehydrogenase [mine drainage metagenome]|uniref:Short chain dehydrogenase n=1 Tax=mine drainage metagenome TaxID=410659 RepID=A0A1J5RQQ6_9ZZZZ
MIQSVLVLGASGFIGRRVVQALAAADGCIPLAAGRRLATRTEDGIEALHLDGGDEPALAAALTRVQAVVDCTAAPPETMRRISAALFRAANAAGRPLVVQLSSMAVYGNAVGRVAETAALSDEQGPYAAAKLAGERLAADYGRAVILRPGCVYGPGGLQWSLRLARLLRARRLGDQGAEGDGIANLVHVDDVARAVVAAVRQGRAEGQAFNLAMAGAPTWNEYLMAFAQALGAVPVRRLSARRLRLETKLLAPPLKILEMAAARAGAVAWAPPLVPPSLARLFRQEIRLDSGKSERLLGQTWMPLDEGLAETAAWCRAQRA